MPAPFGWNLGVCCRFFCTVRRLACPKISPWYRTETQLPAPKLEFGRNLDIFAVTIWARQLTEISKDGLLIDMNRAVPTEEHRAQSLGRALDRKSVGKGRSV